MELLLIMTAFLLVSVIPLALAGPVAAWLFVSAAKKKKLSRFSLLGLVIINILLFIYIVGLHGHSMFGPGDIAICGIPVAILVTIQIFNASKNDVMQLIEDDLQQQEYYAMGRTLVPISQALIIFIICSLTTIFDR